MEQSCSHNTVALQLLWTMQLWQCHYHPMVGTSCDVICKLKPCLYWLSSNFRICEVNFFLKKKKKKKKRKEASHLPQHFKWDNICIIANILHLCDGQHGWILICLFWWLLWYSLFPPWALILWWDVKHLLVASYTLWILNILFEN